MEISITKQNSHGEKEKKNSLERKRARSFTRCDHGAERACSGGGGGVSCSGRARATRRPFLMAGFIVRSYFLGVRAPGAVRGGTDSLLCYSDGSKRKRQLRPYTGKEGENRRARTNNNEITKHAQRIFLPVARAPPRKRKPSAGRKRPGDPRRTAARVWPVWLAAVVGQLLPPRGYYL